MEITPQQLADLRKIPFLQAQQSDPSLMLFPIINSVPTDPALDGTIRLALISGTYYLYARINKVWKKTTIT